MSVVASRVLSFQVITNNNKNKLKIETNSNNNSNNNTEETENEEPSLSVTEKTSETIVNTGIWLKLPSPATTNVTAATLHKQINYDNVFIVQEFIENAVYFVHSLTIKSTTDTDTTLDSQLTCTFRGNCIPDISIQDYIIQIVKYINQHYEYRSNSLKDYGGFIDLVGGFVLLERLVDSTDLKLNDWTVHRALITSVLIAHKLLEDDCASNRFFSCVGGITLEKMNTLEIIVCEALEFNLHLGNRLWEIANVIALATCKLYT
jgi:hypothetical protein